MNIVLGQEQIVDLVDRYVVLPLDTFRIPGRDGPVQSYCVVENAAISDLQQLDTLRQLHHKLIENYGRRNWNFCQQAIEHLLGHWNGELDSFYTDLAMRVNHHKQNEPGPEWSSIIDRVGKDIDAA